MQSVTSMQWKPSYLCHVQSESCKTINNSTVYCTRWANRTYSFIIYLFLVNLTTCFLFALFLTAVFLFLTLYSPLSVFVPLPKKLNVTVTSTDPQAFITIFKLNTGCCYIDRDLFSSGFEAVLQTNPEAQFDPGCLGVSAL